MVFAKKFTGENKDPSGVNLELDQKHCPTCGRDMPPWYEQCPDDGTATVSLSEVQSSTGPEIPEHLLEASDEDPPPES